MNGSLFPANKNIIRFALLHNWIIEAVEGKIEREKKKFIE